MPLGSIFSILMLVESPAYGEGIRADRHVGSDLYAIGYTYIQYAHLCGSAYVIAGLALTLDCNPMSIAPYWLKGRPIDNRHD